MEPDSTVGSLREDPVQNDDVTVWECASRLDPKPCRNETAPIWTSPTNPGAPGLERRRRGRSHAGPRDSIPPALATGRRAHTLNET